MRICPEIETAADDLKRVAGVLSGSFGSPDEDLSGVLGGMGGAVESLGEDGAVKGELIVAADEVHTDHTHRKGLYTQV